MAQALKIDIVTQTVTPVTINSLEDITTTIGNGCSSLNIYQYPNGDFMYYDFASLFREPIIGGFVTEGTNTLLFNNAVIIGYADGNYSDCVSQASAITSATTWYDQAYCQDAIK